MTRNNLLQKLRGALFKVDWTTSAMEKDVRLSDDERSTESQQQQQHLEVIHHENGNTYYVLSKQAGARVCRVGNDHIIKHGSRVSPAELSSMKLVEEHTDVPIGAAFHSLFDGETGHGSIFMEIVSGVTMDKVWLNLDETNKEHLCQATWTMILKLRQIPRPADGYGYFACLSNGSPTNDPLIEDADKTSPIVMLTGDEVRIRICDRYREHGGRKYEKEDLFEMLPESSESVFTHADIAPRNIMVQRSDTRLYEITGIIDWESAGWYPHYWEYSNMFRPGTDHIYDWQRWMDKSAPAALKCSLQGLKAARRVLF